MQTNAFWTDAVENLLQIVFRHLAIVKNWFIASYTISRARDFFFYLRLIVESFIFYFLKKFLVEKNSEIVIFLDVVYFSLK